VDAQTTLETKGLAELVRAEAEERAGALDAALAQHVVRAGTGWRRSGKALQGSRAGFDEDDDGGTDDLARLAEHPDARLTAVARQQKDMKRAVAADRQYDSAIASCSSCLDSSALRKHLIISLGDHSYLALPPGCGRLPGQLRIVPVSHAAAMTEVDEEVYAEVNRFKAALHALFSSQGRDGELLCLNRWSILRACVRLVLQCSSLRLRRGRVIDGVTRTLIAFPWTVKGADAPLYFRKAILDSEEMDD